MTAHTAGRPECSSERGAGLAEYALLLALIAMACITAVTTVGARVAALLGSAAGMF